MRYLLLICGFLFFKLASSQTTIRGVVFDKSTGQAVCGSNLLIDGTTDGGITDSDGNFVITTSKQLPLQLRISDIRYKTQVVDVDSYNLLIGINPDVKVLREVVIDGSPFVVIHPGSQYHAYDFEFYNDVLMILAFKNRKEESELFVADLNGIIDTSFHLPDGSCQLLADYSGTVHLITNDSAYQVYYTHRNLYLLYPCKPQQLFQVLGACAGTFEGKLIWQYADMNRLRLSFFAGDGKTTKLLYTVTDSLSLRYRNRRLPLSHFVKLRNANDERYGYSLSSLASSLEFLRNTADLDWYDRRYMKAAMASFLVVGNKPVVFDFTNGRAVHLFDSLGVTNFHDIRFHQERGWQKKILFDKEMDALYTTYQQNGITRIASLDKNSFAIVANQYIPGHRFIGKLRIKKGSAYFLHRDQIDEGRRMVTKMSLKGPVPAT